MQVAKTCGACKQPIEGECLVAFDMAWHTNHLLCKVCGTTFSQGNLCEGSDGYAYCLEHWRQTFCPICAECNEYIEGPNVNALDRFYHPDHFTCVMCKKRLEAQFYASSDGKPLCELDYHRENNNLCKSCQNPIISGKLVKIDINDKEARYHAEHFTCSFCQTNLVGKKYKLKKDQPYCIDCSLKLFE
ncbi:LIM domain-containing protein DDB_G0271356-like [Schistocerca gregaria]|uniref:LIM domain-containing protein DDB_G0271356-like n=1 Tax=Schistocerca gregaria TaxID=7010 RepID=UPI00211EDE8A|nr:LIM domain-containing protein DDB_G0271356-like [Schistocerca gregaria]